MGPSLWVRLLVTGLWCIALVDGTSSVAASIVSTPQPPATGAALSPGGQVPEQRTHLDDGPTDRTMIGLRLALSLPVDGAATAVAWSADGSRIAAAWYYGIDMSVWDTHGTTISEFKGSGKGPYPGSSLRTRQESTARSDLLPGRIV